eukprot:187751-Pelagomonas_calceolata.AAC.1
MAKASGEGDSRLFEPMPTHIATPAAPLKSHAPCCFSQATLIGRSSHPDLRRNSSHWTHRRFAWLKGCFLEAETLGPVLHAHTPT